MSDIRSLLADTLREHPEDNHYADPEGFCQNCRHDGGYADHLADVLLALDRVAIIELPEASDCDDDDEDRPKQKGDYLKRSDSKSEVWIEGLPDEEPYVFFGRRHFGPSYFPAEYARDVAAALLSAAVEAEKATEGGK